MCSGLVRTLHSTDALLKRVVGIMGSDLIRGANDQRFVLEHQEQMNETELAKKLGISRKCLWERRQRFDIPRRKKGT